MNATDPAAVTGNAADLASKARHRLVDQTFDADTLVVLRNTVAAHASRIGLTAQQVNDLVLVIQELASNAVRHGAGHGRLLLWRDNHDICLQVTDRGLGRTDLHLLGHHAPPPPAPGGRGLWLARQLTHHLDIHTDDNGTQITARIDQRTPPPARQ